MATRVRKTISQNPLDEISAFGKTAQKTAASVKKSSVATKTTRAPKASQTVAKTQTTQIDPKPKASRAVPKPKKSTLPEGSSEKVKREPRPAKTAPAKSAPANAVAKAPLSQEGVNDGAATSSQSAEQLMAAELNRPAVPISRREEDLISHWCAPVKVLDQPGVTGSPAGVGPIGQFLTAEDVFQNELIRARVSVKAEETKTRLSAHKIVARWSRWSLAASVVPLPLLDMAAISGVQVKMIYELCKTYEVDFEHKAAVAIASGVAGGAAVQTLAGVIAKQMLRFAPGVGQIFMFAVEPLMSYVTTQAIGLAFISHFEDDGRMHDFNPEKIKQYMAAQIEKRKQMFRSKIRPQQA